MIKLQPKSGLTLIELVVVMAILAVLSTVIGGNLLSSISKGRDSKRKQDLQSIAKALEIYYYDYKAYPTPPMDIWGQQFVNDTDPSIIYMSKLPVDPSYPNSTYCYESNGSGSYFRIYANLENANDPQILTPTQECAMDSLQYNYAISSTNVGG